MQPFIQKFFINFLFVQSLFKQLGLNIWAINEMAERFSQKNLIILDAIKASVPKFLNFLGAELNNKCITRLEG